MKSDVKVDLDGKHLSLTNLDKVLYPIAGFTKAQVIDYYDRIAPVLLPHLKDRPLTLKRYPDGVDGDYFYEKACPPHRPDWVHTVAISGARKKTDYCLANDRATLMWLANLADLELHISLSRAGHIPNPDTVVFDLDPGRSATIIDCARVGLQLRNMCDTLGLAAYIKTSGLKGLQVYVPLNTPVTYAETKSFALAAATLLEKQHPDEVTADMKKKLRVGRVFIDWSQNDEHKTTVCAYSLRAAEQPRVSTPLAWPEVEAAVKKNAGDRLRFDALQVIERIDRVGDIFAPVLESKQKLPSSFLLPANLLTSNP